MIGWSESVQVSRSTIMKHVVLFFMFITCKRFRKPWLRVKSVDFDFSAKLSSTDYNQPNKPTSKSLAHIGFENLFIELEVLKNVLFFTSLHFSLYRKVYFSPWAIGNVKLSSTDNNEPNKPNPKSLAHIESEKSLVELGVPKNEFSLIFHSTENFTISS